MRLQNRGILINVVLALTFVVLLRFYPAWAVALTAAVFFAVANVGLVFRARKERTRMRGEGSRG